MAEAADREKLIADAWKRWREADYTWDGLTKKEWEGWRIIVEGDVEIAVEAIRMHRSHDACDPFFWWQRGVGCDDDHRQTGPTGCGNARPAPQLVGSRRMND